MPLNVGDKLGPYEIIDILGKGGMGEVYRARDPRLGRDVAIKVSAEKFSDRFEREARLVASLNHPNVCTLHDIGPDYLVMELVEGSTLAERIAEGPIALNDALGFARQIADALEAAHDKGIIHRDLKPANIKVTRDSRVKVLDFGLAKVFGDAAPGLGLSNSPTMMSAGSVPGMILGTAAYMSPEQARGREVDKRTDIWAFGCILYEMLSGRQAFQGDSITDILASIVTAEPDWTELPPETPGRVRVLLRRCLQKDPSRRIRDIVDARLELDDSAGELAEPQHGGGGAPANRRREWLAWGIATAAILLAVVFIWGPLGGRPPEAAPTWLSIVPPYREFAFSAAPAISPDGRRIAFWAHNEAGRSQLWVRSLDSLETRALPGTESDFIVRPFWSPDGKSLGFFSGDKLKRIDVDSGSPQELADVAGPRGGTWGADDVIVYAPGLIPNLYRVSASGRDSVALPPLELQTGKAIFCTDPDFLPDGRRFFAFCTAESGEESGVYVASLDNAQAVPLPELTSSPVYADGYVFFSRGEDLLAQEFDVETLKLGGQPVRIAAQVGRAGSGLSLPAVTASPAGVLAFWSSPMFDLTELTWFDRQGHRISSVGDPAERNGLMLSPDETEVVFEFHDTQLNWIDLMRLNLSSGNSLRLTTRAGGVMGWGANTPVWSPDGRRILFNDNSGRWSVKDTSSNQTDSVFRSTSGGLWFQDWSGDDVVYVAERPDTGTDLFLFPMAGGGQPREYLTSRYSKWGARISPDSRWLAYSSNETGGRFEIYIQSFPEAGVARRISRNGGKRPMWRQDGKELFYINADNMLMAVPISLSESGLTVLGPAVELFKTPLTGSEDIARPQYFPVHDGQKFLFNAPAEDSRPRALHVLQNWPALVRR